MANDLVVRLGARLDQFAADMDQAGNIADSTVSRIEQSFANLNPGINLGALAGLTGGAVAAIGTLLTALGKVNSELADIAKNAEYAGVSVERFQELRFAATQGGVGSGAATNDLRNVARLLADAKENENSLTKLLDANNIKYTDRNGDVIKLNQLLTVAGDLIGKFGSMPEKVEAAKMLGLSEQWVEALKGGGKAFNDLAAGAEEAGAVIDRSTIAKAEAFDTAWKKSTALLSTQFQAATGEAAGYLDDLIEKANDFFTELAKARGTGVGDSGQATFNAYADAIAVAEKEARGLTQDVEQLTRVIDRMVAKGGDPEIIAGLEAARVKAQELATELAKANLAAAMTNFPGGKVPLPGARPAGANADSGTASLPSRAKAVSDTADAYDRQVNSINRHIAVMQSQTNTVGESVGAQEELRVAMLLSEQAAEAGRDMTRELNDEIAVQAERAGKTKQALAESTFQLQKMNAASQQVGSALSSAFADAVVEGKKLNEVFASLLKTLEKAAINSVFASMFSPGAGETKSPFMQALSGMFAEGTNYAPGGMAIVGEKGPELVNLPRGSQVIPNAAIGGSGGGTIVYSPAIDARGASVDAVARLAQILAEDRASFASRTVHTIQQARRGRVPGL
jgi:hypothetical protein